MSSDVRAAIPKPSICRMVAVSRKDGMAFAIGAMEQTPMLVREMPATVVGVETEDDLTILVMVGARWMRRPHRELCAVDMPGETMVWTWPPRV